MMDMKLEVVVVPVSDVDRARRFYAEQVGFAVDLDHQVSDDVRVVQLTPPGSGCSITIGSGLTTMPPGSLQGLQLVVSDIDAVRSALVGRGVECTPVRHHNGTGFVDGHGGDWNSFVFFDDPDGNAWAIQQRPT